MPAERAAAAPSPRRRREPWPLALGGLLAGMAVVLVAFLSVALARPDPVIVDDAYAASARYDAALRAVERAAANGTQLDASAAPGPDGARVAVRLRDAAGRPLSADRITVARERPAEGGLDGQVEVTPSADGWTATVPLPRPGRWIVEVRAERGDELLVRRIPVDAGP